MSGERHLETLRFTNTNAGKIAYSDTGSGEMAVFVHGLPLCSYQWRDITSNLADKYRCIAIDQLGLGYTEPRPGQSTTFAAQSATLLEVVDQLGGEKIHLVGNDTGAGICQVFAASNSDRVKTLTLTNCEVHDLWPNDFLKTFYDGLGSGEFATQLEAMVNDPSLAPSGLGALVYKDASMFDKNTVDRLSSPIISSPDRLSFFRSLADWETNRSQLMSCKEGLERLSAPTQLLWGMTDPVFDAAPSIAWLERHLPNHNRTIAFGDGKLFFPNEYPEDLLKPCWNSGGNPKDSRNSVTRSKTKCLRAAQGVVALAKPFGTRRLEAARQRALAYDSAKYRTVKTILDNGLDRTPVDEIEIMGRLTQVPYWECLDIKETNPLVQKQVQAWFDALSQKELTTFTQAKLKALGHYGGPLNGVNDAKTREAIAYFKSSQGLVANGEVRTLHHWDDISFPYCRSVGSRRDRAITQYALRFGRQAKRIQIRHRKRRRNNCFRQGDSLLDVGFALRRSEGPVPSTGNPSKNQLL